MHPNLQPGCLPVTRKDPGIPLIDWMIFHGRKPHIHRHRTFLVLLDEVKASYSHVCGGGKDGLVDAARGYYYTNTTCSGLCWANEQIWATWMDHFPYPKWLSKGLQQGECWAPTSCCCMKKALWLALMPEFGAVTRIISLWLEAGCTNYTPEN